MKGMVMAGMMALSLVLGAMAVFSDTWLTSEDTEEGMTTTTNTGLSTYQQVGDMGDSDMCEGMGAMMEEMVEDSESECDGSELTWTTPMSNFCEMLEDMGDESSADDCNDTACALKVFNKKDYLKIDYFKNMHRFLPALFKMNNGRIFNVLVDDRRRFAGVSKFNFNNSPFL